MSLLLLDIDDFKAVNDRHGHREGDRILIELARVLVEQTRDSDICCRVGGEEFVVILPLTASPKEACDIAERIRARAARIACVGQQITVSVGVAICDGTASSSCPLLEIADRAMYEAKVAGKNRVVLAEA